MLFDSMKILDGIKYVFSENHYSKTDYKELENSIALYKLARKLYDDPDQLIHFLQKSCIFSEKLCSMLFVIGVQHVVQHMDSILNTLKTEEFKNGKN